ncbi:MAG TPA: sugar phosphate isomerase/epimerase [Candidatus Paenibacillus intestinavium]|nr:sugar phosphate isomerase/epimerase [Candidatus Paenibacillus intestinavium]
MTKQSKIGVQMFNLKQKVEELGVYATLEKLHDMGFHSVEVTQIAMTAENVAQLKKASEDFGIQIAAVSAPLSKGEKDPGESLTTHFDKIVNDCKELSCQYIRIGMMPLAIMGHKDQVMQYIADAEAMANRLAEHGLELYYHNHHVEFEKYDGEYLIDMMRNHTTKLGFELDVHWIQRGGENPVAVINRFQGRIGLLHLKDYRVGRLTVGEDDLKDMSNFMQKFTNIIEFAELGQGSLDIPAIIDAGLESGVKHFFIEQDDTNGRDPFDCLEDSKQYLVRQGYGDWI